MQTTMRYAHWEDAPVNAAAANVSDAISAALSAKNETAARPLQNILISAPEFSRPANDAPEITAAQNKSPL